MRVLTIVSVIIAAIILFFSCEKEITTSPKDDPIYGSNIIVNSNPQGAEIFINGDNTGKFTPDSIIHLEQGEYNIKVRLYPYLDIIDSFFVEDNSTKKFTADFYSDTRNFGSITIDSDPTGALIFLSDSCLNQTTPYTIPQLWPGLYSIGCIYPVHRQKNTYVLVRGGEHKSTFLTLQDTSVFVDYREGNSNFPYTSTICIEVDSKNNKWVGTAGNGLVKYNENEAVVYNSANSELPDDNINCISIDNSNRVWVGTSHGLVIIDNGVWSVYTVDNSDIPHDAIAAITFDVHGNSWIGASDPRIAQLLVKFDGTNWYSYPAPNSIISLCVDNEDRVWVGLSQSVLLFVNGTWETIVTGLNYNALLAERSVESIAKDIDGRIWICAGSKVKGPYPIPGGLIVYENNSFRVIDLPEKIVSHIHINNKGTKWVSCFGKYPVNNLSDNRIILMKIDINENITGYTRGDNLPGTLLRNSSSASNGDLWIASRDRGIIKFKRANL